MNTLKYLHQYASLSRLVNKFHIDFYIDRLSNTHTSSLILLCITITSMRHLKSTIDCWIPKELKRYEAYMTKLCWLKGTYYLPIDKYGNVIDEKLYDKSEEFKKEALISYYQWIIIILLLQAFMFYVPYILWASVANRDRFEISNIMTATSKYDSYEKNDSDDKRPQDRILLYLASFFKRMNYQFKFEKYKDNKIEVQVENNETTGYSIKFLYSLFCKANLHLFYLFVKLMYLSNCILQMRLINYFLTNSVYNFDALGILQQMLNGENNQETEIFPIIVQCDLNISHDLDDAHLYSIRCILSMNMFVEKIYVFLWIWCAIVASMTFFDLIRWSARFIFMKQNYRFVKNRLNSATIKQANILRQKYFLKLFVYEYLSRDGIFILRLIENNAGLIVSNDLISKLWSDFCVSLDICEEKSLT